MATSTVLTNKPINPRGDDNRPVDSYNRAALYSGKALDFDGVNDYVSVSDVDSLSFGNGTTDSPFSITGYFNLDVLGTNKTIAAKDNGSQREYALFVTSDNKLRFFLKNNGGSPQQSIDSDLVLEAGKWYFVAATYDGRGGNLAWQGLNIYVNAQLTGVDSNIANTYTAMANTTAGFAAGVYASTFMNGQISNIKVFGSELTAAQVSDLYNNPEKIVPTGVEDTALKLWLPMMEGAGTTAYDGSGNGNHGTISGATYVNGVGSPVAQTAVIDWNKLYDFDSIDDKAYNASYQDTTGTKSYKVHFIAHDVNTEGQIFQIYNFTSKKGAGATIDFNGTNNGILGFRGFINGVNYGIQSWSVEANTYYELAITINWDTDTIVSATLNGESPTGVISARIDTSIGGLFLGARNTQYYLNGIINYFEVVGEEKWTNASGFKSESGSYDMTITGSPSQILAPKGLTSGRDITGVNLFENVRKQGALNLDGNSWAEVHDNGSLDFGTGEFTLEAWVRAKYENTGSALNVVLNLGGNASNAGAVCMLVGSTNKVTAVYNNSYLDSNTILTEGEWYHIVVNFNGTHSQIYINGVFDKNVTRTAADISNVLVKEIGRDSTVARTYKDQIAQPRIYNRALTASEVLNNYNATKTQYQ
jgi:hypothetical protein